MRRLEPHPAMQTLKASALVLLSFMLVNLSLPWVASRRAKGSRRARRALDLVLPSLAFLMCGWLLIHTGWPSLAAAAGLAIVGLAVGRCHPGRGAAAHRRPRTRRTDDPTEPQALGLFPRGRQRAPGLHGSRPAAGQTSEPAAMEVPCTSAS